MKVKLIRGVVFHILVMAIFCFLNYRYVHSTYFRSIEGLFRYENVPNSLQIVNFGSSHGQFGLDYSVLPDYRCFNFALSSQMPYLDELLLETYESNLSDDCVVVIPVSYFSLYMNPDDWLNAQLPRYCRILDVNKIPNANLKDLINYRYFPVLSSKKNLRKLFSAHSPPVYSVKDGVTDATELDELGEKRAAFHLGLAKNQAIVSEQANSIIGMLQLCRENGWTPIVITTPLTIYYNKWFSTDFINTFHFQLHELISDYPEAMYWDYSNDERFYNHPEFFVDTDHLNQSGRELFTRILFEDCRNGGLI